jgi:hypothetical protein
MLATPAKHASPGLTDSYQRLRNSGASVATLPVAFFNGLVKTRDVDCLPGFIELQERGQAMGLGLRNCDLLHVREFLL